MQASIPETMTPSEAFEALRAIRRACPDVNFRVISVADIVEHCLGVDVVNQMTDEQYATACELARGSWELRKWGEMSESDWHSLDEAIIGQFAVEMSEKYA